MIKIPLHAVGLPKTPNVDPEKYPDEKFELYSVPSFSTGFPEHVRGREIGSTKQVVQPGDVLLCKIVPHLVRVWCVGSRGNHRQIASGEWIVLRPNPQEVNKDYLRYVLTEPSFRSEFMKTVSGVGGSLMRARPKEVARITIPVPSVHEQIRIVSKLDTLFMRTKKARQELARIPRLVDRYRHALLKKAFKGDLTFEWRDKNRRISVPVLSDTITEYRKASFQAPYEVPPTWSWVELSRLGVLDRGRSRHRPRNAPELYGGPYPFVQTGDIRAARGLLTKFEQTYSDRGLAQSRLWPKGTLCITIAANIAETAILGLDACFPDSVVGFTANEELCASEFIEFFIRTVKEELAAFAPATAQKNINLETLRTLRVPCPPVQEQDEIVRKIKYALDRVDAVTDDVSRSETLLNRLEQITLAKAFRGELLSAEHQSNNNDVVQSDLVLPAVV